MKLSLLVGVFAILTFLEVKNAVAAKKDKDNDTILSIPVPVLGVKVGIIKKLPIVEIKKIENEKSKDKNKTSDSSEESSEAEKTTQKSTKSNPPAADEDDTTTIPTTSPKTADKPPCKLTQRYLVRTYTHQYKKSNGQVTTFRETRKFKLRIVYVVRWYRSSGKIRYTRTAYYQYPLPSKYSSAGKDPRRASIRPLKKIGPDDPNRKCLEADDSGTMAETEFKKEYSKSYGQSITSILWKLYRVKSKSAGAAGSEEEAETLEGIDSGESAQHFIDKETRYEWEDEADDAEPDAGNPPELPESGTYEKVTRVQSDEEEDDTTMTTSPKAEDKLTTLKPPCEFTARYLVRTYTHQYKKSNGQVTTFTEIRKFKLRIVYVVMWYRSGGKIRYTRTAYYQYPLPSKYSAAGKDPRKATIRPLKKIGAEDPNKKCLQPDESETMTESEFKRKYTKSYGQSITSVLWKLYRGKKSKSAGAGRGEEGDDNLEGIDAGENAQHFIDTETRYEWEDEAEDAEPDAANPPKLPESGTYEKVSRVESDEEDSQADDKRDSKSSLTTTSSGSGETKSSGSKVGRNSTKTRTSKTRPKNGGGDEEVEIVEYEYEITETKTSEGSKSGNSTKVKGGAENTGRGVNNSVATTSKQNTKGTEEVSVVTETTDGGKTGNSTKVKGGAENTGRGVNNSVATTSKQNSKGTEEVVVVTETTDGGKTGNNTKVKGGADKSEKGVNNSVATTSKQNSKGTKEVVAVTETTDGGKTGNNTNVKDKAEKSERGVNTVTTTSKPNSDDTLKAKLIEIVRTQTRTKHGTGANGTDSDALGGRSVGTTTATTTEKTVNSDKPKPVGNSPTAEKAGVIVADAESGTPKDLTVKPAGRQVKGTDKSSTKATTKPSQGEDPDHKKDPIPAADTKSPKSTDSEETGGKRYPVSDGKKMKTTIAPGARKIHPKKPTNDGTVVEEIEYIDYEDGGKPKTPGGKKTTVAPVPEKPHPKKPTNDGTVVEEIEYIDYEDGGKPKTPRGKKTNVAPVPGKPHPKKPTNDGTVVEEIEYIYSEDGGKSKTSGGKKTNFAPVSGKPHSKKPTNDGTVVEEIEYIYSEDGGKPKTPGGKKTTVAPVPGKPHPKKPTNDGTVVEEIEYIDYEDGGKPKTPGGKKTNVAPVPGKPHPKKPTNDGTVVEEIEYIDYEDGGKPKTSGGKKTTVTPVPGKPHPKKPTNDGTVVEEIEYIYSEDGGKPKTPGGKKTTVAPVPGKPQPKKPTNDGTVVEEIEYIYYEDGDEPITPGQKKTPVASGPGKPLPKKPTNNGTVVEEVDYIDYEESDETTKSKKGQIDAGIISGRKKPGNGGLNETEYIYEEESYEVDDSGSHSEVPSKRDGKTDGNRRPKAGPVRYKIIKRRGYSGTPEDGENGVKRRYRGQGRRRQKSVSKGNEIRRPKVGSKGQTVEYIYESDESPDKNRNETVVVEEIFEGNSPSGSGSPNKGSEGSTSTITTKTVESGTTSAGNGSKQNGSRKRIVKKWVKKRKNGGSFSETETSGNSGSNDGGSGTGINRVVTRTEERAGTSGSNSGPEKTGSETIYRKYEDDAGESTGEDGSKGQRGAKKAGRKGFRRKWTRKSSGQTSDPIGGRNNEG